MSIAVWACSATAILSDMTSNGILPLCTTALANTFIAAFALSPNCEQRVVESGEAEAIAGGRDIHRAAACELAGDEHGCQMVHKFLLEEALDWPGSEIRVEAL